MRGDRTDPPRVDRLLVTGPSNAGKTRLTYDLLRGWVDRHGPEGVVVFEFAPALERDGDVLGGRLDRFGPIPDGVTLRVVDACAPRAEGEDEAESLRLAERNAALAAAVIEDAPADVRAVFVNDATIPFQADGDPSPLTEYAASAELSVLNAFDSDELGTEDPVSVHERAALAALRSWADREDRLERD